MAVPPDVSEDTAALRMLQKLQNEGDSGGSCVIDNILCVVDHVDTAKNEVVVFDREHLKLMKSLLWHVDCYEGYDSRLSIVIRIVSMCKNY